MAGGIPFFCSELSSGAGEEPHGTASVGEAWLLVEYPAAWQPKALEGSALPPPVKRHLTRLLKEMPRSRLLFIKQARQSPDRATVFVARTRESAPSVFRFSLPDYEGLLDFDAAVLRAPGRAPGAERHDEPLYLVCTHGLRDKCCAKFGWPLYKSLRERAGGRVWQSSHVGGDRFAANLVCFPHGLFYARVTEESGRRIMGDYEAGRVTLENYRGRACYGHGAQAAEFYVRRESGLRGLDDLRLLDCVRAGESAQRVRFSSAGGEVIHTAVVGRRESFFRTFVTCHDHEPRAVSQYALEEYTTGPPGAAF